MTEILDEGAVSEIEAQLNSGSLLLPLRVEGWHKSLTNGGHIVRHSTGRTLATVEFVPVENETGRPALDGNAPARAVVTLLNAIPALCATVKHLRSKHEQLALASGEWASLLDRIRAWSKCGDGYPLDEHINNIVVDRERLQSQLEQLRAENEALRIEIKEKERGDFDWKQSRP